MSVSQEDFAGWTCLMCRQKKLGTTYTRRGLGPLCRFCAKDVERHSAEPGNSKIVSDGGSTDYYKLPEHAAELRHLISHKGMSKSRGDVFKACYRLGEKEGAEILYDLRKMKFFVEDLIEMYERGERL